MHQPPTSMLRVLQNMDQFRTISGDLTRGSLTGGVFTAIAWGALILLLIAELAAFMRTTYETTIVMDQNENKEMTINFDVLLFDLPCKYLKLGIWDKFGFEKLEASEAFHYVPVDFKGEHRGDVYTKEEIAALEQVDAQTDVSEEEKKELDSDWAGTDIHFHDHDFNKAMKFHDFTIVNFFAEWCSHCRQFAPAWRDLAEKTSEKIAFKDGHSNEVTVKFMKMNCVAFGTHCQEAKIAAFPTIRLYKRDGSFESFRAKRTAENIMKFLQETIQASQQIVVKHHAMFSEGCQVTGSFKVPRVPGHLYMQAESFGNTDVNPALTNVSHRINHFSFGEKQARLFAERANIPKDVLKHLAPLDARTFSLERFHEAPQHYLKVVSTQVHGRPETFYQLTHTDRIRKLKLENKEGLAPQVRFTWDFSPLSVVVKPKSKRWYEFLTSLFAILGGTYTIVQLCGGAAYSVGHAVKEAMGKAS